MGGRLFSSLMMMQRATHAGTRPVPNPVKVREFMEKAAKLISAHYPERSFRIMIINAPWWVRV